MSIEWLNIAPIRQTVKHPYNLWGMISISIILKNKKRKNA